MPVTDRWALSSAPLFLTAPVVCFNISKICIVTDVYVLEVKGMTR